MGPGLHAVGSAYGEPRFKTRAEFLDSIEAIVKQDVVDIMLTSVSNLESLVKRNVFAGTGVKPVIRANDTTDVWRHRGASFHNQPSRPFRTASLRHVKPLTDLGLYSITFTNDIDADHASLEAFKDFRDDAEANGFSYFLEVFNPNVERGLTPETMPQFVNDAIVRCLAGLTEAERPKFLKIAYNGPRALEELASFDPSLVVGVLGGGAGTTRDCFELIHQAQKYGARVALFGRKINLAEVPARHRPPHARGRGRRHRPARGGQRVPRGASEAGSEADARDRARQRDHRIRPQAGLTDERTARRAVGGHLVRRFQ